jgi:photosystem II stability/assembly factor-like uncharacterized protein
VTQAIGVWTTGGPYGGAIMDLAVSPVTNQTAFAAVGLAGLFRTENGGAHWDLLIEDIVPVGVGYGVAPTSTLYFWGSSGLWRSNDRGETFQQVSGGWVWSFAPDPLDENRLWMVNFDLVYLSTNGGLDWEPRNNGLPQDSRISFLVIDPRNSSIIYVVLSDGSIYKSSNLGLEWLWVTDSLAPAREGFGHRLAINPQNPNVLFYWNGLGSEPGYRSRDGGQTWMVIETVPSGIAIITDLAFSQHVSGTVYASWNADLHLAGASMDGGITWQPLGSRESEDFMISIALDPAEELPTYLGSGSAGVRRSYDGGQTWEVATHGTTGLEIEDIAAVPGQPETVYVANLGAGAFTSSNAGRSWLKLDLPYASARAVVVDPQDPQRVYVSAGGDIFRSHDGGLSWESVSIPGERGSGMETMAMSAVTSSVIYAAGYDESWVVDGNVGRAIRSEDYGVTWAPLTFTLPVSIVSDIIVDPTDAGTLYVAAGNWTSDMSSHPGKGVFRSVDSGETWEHLTATMGAVPAFALAINPEQPQEIYASAWLSSEEKVTVFESTDGGDSWTATSLRASRDYLGLWAIPSLAIDPRSPNVLYAGAEDGLFRSIDGGTTWTRAAGELGYASVMALNAACDGERTIVYAGTIGSKVDDMQVKRWARMTTEGASYVSGGVYQQTIVHRPVVATVYLPLVLRTD